MSQGSVLGRQAGSEVSSYPNEAASSGVSWAAIVAGAAVTAALSLIMLALGAGLGLSSISPWSRAGAESSTLATGAIVWLILNELISSALGGYLAGRLRTKWASIHTDEVYFRDTAHGFMVWAVAVIITAGFLGAAASSMVGGTAVGATSPATAPKSDAQTYFVDSLFRGANTQGSPTDVFLYGEADRIFARAIAEKQLPDADKTYLAQQVATKTGISAGDAQARVSNVFDQARTAADTTRRATAHILLWLFLALLIGAFSSSYAATIGGRQRDHLQAV